MNELHKTPKKYVPVFSCTFMIYTLQRKISYNMRNITLQSVATNTYFLQFVIERYMCATTYNE